jgi:hypothetical protein
MGDEKDPEIEYSKLGGAFEKDGVSVDVQIYRLLDREDGWSLEVVDHENASTVWDELFPTDAAAYAAFEETIAEEGIQTFTEPRH